MEPDLFDMEFEDRISGSGMYPDPTDEGVEDPFWDDEEEEEDEDEDESDDDEEE